MAKIFEATSATSTGDKRSGPWDNCHPKRSISLPLIETVSILYQMQKQ